MGEEEAMKEKIRRGFVRIFFRLRFFFFCLFIFFVFFLSPPVKAGELSMPASLSALPSPPSSFNLSSALLQPEKWERGG